MNEDIERLNKLAKSLKDTGLAPSMDKAIEMAKDMMKEEQESISELQGKEAPEEKEGFVEKVEEVVEDVKEKVEEVVEDIKEKIHIREEKPQEDIKEKIQERKEEAKKEVEEE